MVKFEIQGQPQGKARPKVTLRGSFAHAYTPKKTVEYEDLIRLSYKQQCDKYYADKPLAISVQILYAIPKSFSKRKRIEAIRGNLRPQTKPDIDNVLKVICDALNGIAYADDKQILQIYAEKYYSDIPKLIVTIREAENCGQWL